MIVKYPENKDFPSGEILPLFNNILEKATPEHIERLIEITGSTTFEITDNPKFKLCEVLHGFDFITISRKAIEVLWTMSYAYWEFYHKYYGKSLFWTNNSFRWRC